MRVGLLIGIYNSSYTLNLIKCFAKELSLKGCKLIILEGISLGGNSVSDYQCNTIYRLITSEKIDGLIILAGSLAVHVGKEVIQDLALRIGVPVVSIGLELEGVPSVIPDNSSGFEKIVAHLVSHGYQKMAHISGPLKNPESMLRRDAFMKVIYKNGLDLPKHFLLEGTFGYASGYNLVKKLIPAIKNNEIDAIVCGNDQMAYGSIKCLLENGIKVPEDVAVTGFDDLIMSQHLDPSITTVSQRFNEMCRKAVSILQDIRYGKKDNQAYTFEPQLIIRNSCGCKDVPVSSPGILNLPIIGSFRLNGRLQSLENESFFTVLSDFLAENGIHSCYIVRFMEINRLDDFSGIKQSLKSRIFFGYSNGKRIFYSKPFEAVQLLPESIYESITGPFIIKPIFFNKIQFGFVIVTANENASDFIDDLGPELGHYLENIYLAQERQSVEKKLSDTLESLILTNRKLNELTVKENLDKLNNIRYLASNMLQHRKTGTGDYYLIIVEIDNFLEINNKFGFQEGENLISSVSRILAGSIREDDFLSHQSCDRYVILVKNIQSGTIEAIEKRFNNKLNEINSERLRPYLISFTWGYATAQIDMDFDTVYQEAENSLLSQKQLKSQIIRSSDE